MKRFPSIKKNTDFVTVYRKGRSFSEGLFVMYAMKNGLSYNRIGISVSKKVGNSVVRHGIARKIREIFRLNDINIKTGYDIITVIRPAAREADYKNLNDAYCRLAGRHNIIIKADDNIEESK